MVLGTQTHSVVVHLTKPIRLVASPHSGNLPHCLPRSFFTPGEGVAGVS